MEHRYYPRVAVRNRLLIHTHNSTCVSGDIKNISSGGLALESMNSTCLQKNMLVKVALMVNGMLIILPSQVIRSSKCEAALMFMDDTSPHKQLLKDWLNGAVSN